MAFNKSITRVRTGEYFGFGDNSVANQFFSGTSTMKEIMIQFAKGIALWNPEHEWIEERIEELNAVGMAIHVMLESHQEGDMYEFHDEHDSLTKAP